MNILSVVNHKGGVGKTTSAVNIAACWGLQGKRILLIDLDPQGSASMSFGIRDYGTDLLQALQKTTALPVIQTGVSGVDLVPSGPDLALARQRFSGSIVKELLRQCLKRTEGAWDIVMIDCPPGLENLTVTALWASRSVVIPVEANFLAVSGLNQMIETVNSISAERSELAMGAVVPCRAHLRRRVHAEFMDQLEKLFPKKIAPAVRENAALAEAPGKGKPVMLFAPRSHGAEDYRAVASWLYRHINKKSA
jgi:chromosome partitioning protein